MQQDLALNNPQGLIWQIALPNLNMKRFSTSVQGYRNKALILSMSNFFILTSYNLVILKWRSTPNAGVKRYGDKYSTESKVLQYLGNVKHNLQNSHCFCWAHEDNEP